jgi:hypothetical protein
MKKKQKPEFESKARVIRQLLADDPDDMSIDAQLARAKKIKGKKKKKKKSEREERERSLELEWQFMGTNLIPYELC